MAEYDVNISTNESVNADISGDIDVRITMKQLSMVGRDTAQAL